MQYFIGDISGILSVHVRNVCVLHRIHFPIFPLHCLSDSDFCMNNAIPSLQANRMSMQISDRAIRTISIYYSFLLTAQLVNNMHPVNDWRFIY
jgi:hypothetical protein